MLYENSTDWERAVLIELNREHEYICYIHKVKLRPIGIALFDSETKWGQFDSATRTISISRKLIQEFSWRYVLGIFRHEVAHQLVSEQNSEIKNSNENPHGELFKEACRKIGVPTQFCKAGINLQACNLDWQSESRDPEVEKTLDKAKKLLNLASSTSEHEAQLAMERARELYAKYNLEYTSTAAKENFVHFVITHGKARMESWEQRTIGILSEHFFVKVLTLQQYDAKTCKKVHAVELIGTMENVRMAEHVYHFLLQQVEFLLKKADITRAERKSFRLGVLDGFDKKLTEAKVVTKQATEPIGKFSLTLVGEALEKFKNNTELKNYLREVYPRLKSGRESSVEIYKDAFAAGRIAGKTININKPISCGSESYGRSLMSGRK